MTPDERALKRIDVLLEQRGLIDSQLRALIAQVEQEPAPKRSRYIVPPCGSESAYQRHRYRRDLPCSPCREAHALHNRIKYAKAKLQEAS